MDLALTKRVRTFLHEIPSKGHGIKILLAIVGAVLTSISAQAAIPLPFTPVPVTLQIFTVFLTAGLLGPFYGGLSQLIYVAMGTAGLPWYAGGAAGMQMGVNGGYLAGFMAAGGLVGFLTSHQDFRGELWRIGIAMGVGLVIVYIFGAFHLAMVMGTTYRKTLELGVMPFVIPDIVKIIGAGSLVHWVYGTRWAVLHKKRRGL
jgi:biotin transport system substrate-specific component